uniref:ANF_receptor domain-containing protein n=1 Tax=Macrostomum lignano TaxID=282301 RepID=A0A1I8FWP0_9PLAT
MRNDCYRHCSCSKMSSLIAILLIQLLLLLPFASPSVRPLPPPLQPVCNFHLDSRINSCPGALGLGAEVLGIVLREIFRYDSTTILPYDYPCKFPYACLIRLDLAQPVWGNHYIDSGFLYRDRQHYIYSSLGRPHCPLNSLEHDFILNPTYIQRLKDSCDSGSTLPSRLTESGGYAHVSGIGSQQKKLLLTNLAARDPELRAFLTSFSLPDPAALSPGASLCEFTLKELLKQRNQTATAAAPKGYWSVPQLNESAYLQPLRLALMWPNGSKLYDNQVLHWARRTVAQLNGDPINPEDAAPLPNATTVPSTPYEALRNDSIRLRRAGLRLSLESRGLDCNKADALQFFADSVCPGQRRGRANGPLLGLLAATCSDTVQPIAELSTEMRSVVISPTVESTIYNDPTAYPYFFRTIPSLDAYAEVVTQFLKRHNWPDVALLSSGKLFLRREQFEGKKNGLTVCFEDVVSEESLTLKQAKDNLENAKKKRCQMFVMDYLRRGTCLYLCAAYKHNMLPKNNYMFILSDSARNIFNYTVFCANTGAMQDNNNTDGCTETNLREVADGHLIVRQVPRELTKPGTEAARPVIESKSLMVDYFQYYTQQAILLVTRAVTKLAEDQPSAVYNLNSPSVAARFKAALETTTFASDNSLLMIDSRHDIGRGAINVILRRYNQFKNTTKSFFDSVRMDKFEELRTIKKISRGEQFMKTQVLDGFVWQRLPNGRVEVKHRFKPTATVRYATENELFIQLLREPYSCNQGLLSALRTGMRCSESIVALGCLVFFIILLALMLLFFVLLRHYRQREYQLRAQPFQLLRDQLVKYELDRSLVVLNRKMGAGYFGTVYGGEVNLAGRVSGEVSAWTSCVIKVR